MPENVDDFYNILDNYNNYFNPIEEEGNYKLPDMPTTYPEYLSLDYREKQKWQYTWGHSAMATFKNYAQQQLDININPITGTIKDVENNVTGIDKSIRQSTNDLIRYEMTIDSTASDPHAVPTSDLFTNPKDGSPAITDGSDDWYLTITALDQALVDVYEDTQKYTYAGYSIATQEDAQISLEAINEAIVIKDKIRADLGALQNRFENTITNLNTMAENLQAAESRISDADVSTEMTEFVRQQILTQAAVAMLAQANSLPQMAMQLIGG
ncbi:MAG: hypothetical protein IJU76_02105 [Desulfovibrionaceae bacterium]|nr:hypothetical protein [Desulfovibrionaceae bacterium]